MRYEPHEYQVYATEYIKMHEVSAVLLECGLGKTAITLTAIDDLMFDSFDVHKVLIIAPIRVAKMSWPDEIRKWDHVNELRYSVAVGTEAERKKALEADADIYLINREMSSGLWKRAVFLSIMTWLSSMSCHPSRITRRNDSSP